MKNKITALFFLVCSVSAGLLLSSGGRPGAGVPGDLRDAPADLDAINAGDLSSLEVPLPSRAQPGQVKGGSQREAIYGRNTLNDYYKVDRSLQQLADSVAAFVDKSDLAYDGASGKYKTLTLYTVNQAAGISAGETFSGQKSLSFCSGALVSPTLVLTAGHCINNDPEDPHYFGKVYVVFGWRQTAPGKYDLSFSRDQVFEIESLPVHKLEGSISDSDSYRDFALAALTRAVPGRSPLVIERSRGEGLSVGDKLFAAGYPMGMSVKVTDPDDASIQELGRHNYATDLDAFGGSSGGPVFYSPSRRIAGVLITANAKQRKYTTIREIRLRYRVDADPAAKLALVKEAAGKVLVVPQDKLEGLARTLQAAGCRVEAAAKGGVIVLPLKYSFYNNSRGLVKELIYAAATPQDLHGQPVRLPAYEGIGTGVQKIEAELDLLTPLTDEENRKCEQIRARLGGASPDPAMLRLYRAFSCERSGR